MNQNDYDAFGDIIGEQAGIFGGEQAALEPGLRKHDAVSARPTGEGVVLQMSCQGCGRPTHMLVEWPEIVALRYGVNPSVAYRGHRGVLKNDPTSWEFLPHEHAWRPELKCRQCKFHFPIRIEPHEPERFLAAGRRAGYINPEGEKQVSQIAAQAAQQGKRRR